MNGEIIEIGPAEALNFLSHTFLGVMYEWGINVIRVIQRIESPGLTALMKFITSLGTDYFYALLILFVLWWIDEKRGLRFGILLIVSAWINIVMKDLFKQPRPFSLEPSLGIAFESSYGAPSGHAQLSLTFWIPMAVWFGNIWRRRRSLIWVGAVLLILLIGFSRLYLGVHFPTDLFAGWILGGIVLFLWFVPGSLIEKFFASAGAHANIRANIRASSRLQNICAAGLALVMNGLYPKERTFPALLLGFCLGYTLMKQRFPFCARGEISGKKPGIPIMISRCLTGFAGMTILFLVLRFVFPGGGSLFKDIPVWGPASPFSELGWFIRYGLLGFWVSAGAPRLFQRMGLAAVPPGDTT